MNEGSSTIETVDDIHRLGGGSVENLRIKPREQALIPAGISVLKALSPGEIIRQIRDTFPEAQGLQDAAHVVGSTNAAKIREAGFDVMAAPTRKLPNHHRIIHPDGAAGFTDANLERLSKAFRDRIESI